MHCLLRSYGEAIVPLPQYLPSTCILNESKQVFAVVPGMGLAFMYFWPLFPEHPWAKYCCASVPLASGVLVILVGCGVIREPGLQGAATV